MRIDQRLAIIALEDTVSRLPVRRLVAVTFLWRSLFRLPHCGLVCSQKVFIRAACFSQRLICSWTLACAERQGGATESSPACAAVVCCSSHCLPFASHCSFVCCTSPNVPLPACAAFDASLTPSQAKWVPPTTSCAAQPSSISLQRAGISSCMDETKAAIGL